jgi:hypothetical protein
MGPLFGWRGGAQLDEVTKREHRPTAGGESCIGYFTFRQRNVTFLTLSFLTVAQR